MCNTSWSWQATRKVYNVQARWTGNSMKYAMSICWQFIDWSPHGGVEKFYKVYLWKSGKTWAFFQLSCLYGCFKWTVSKATWKTLTIWWIENLFNPWLELLHNLIPFYQFRVTICDKCDKSVCNFDVLSSVFNWIELMRLKCSSKNWVSRQCTWFEIQNSAISEVNSQCELSIFLFNKNAFNFQFGNVKSEIACAFVFTSIHF